MLPDRSGTRAGLLESSIPSFSLNFGIFALPVILKLLLSMEVNEVIQFMEKFLHLGGLQHLWHCISQGMMAVKPFLGRFQTVFPGQFQVPVLILFAAPAKEMGPGQVTKST
jgi:hypothetical protein